MKEKELDAVAADFCAARNFPTSMTAELGEAVSEAVFSSELDDASDALILSSARASALNCSSSLF